jgi:hypothetical protein
MRPYVVNLTALSFPPRTSRGEVVNAYAAQAAAFFQRLRAALEEAGLMDQVAGFGEAGGLPVVTLTCTPEVADLIARLPGVSGVYPDDAGMLGLL